MRIAGEQTHRDGEKAGGERADEGNELKGRSDAGENQRVGYPCDQEHCGPAHERR